MGRAALHRGHRRPVQRQEQRAREHRGPGLSAARRGHRHSEAVHTRAADRARRGARSGRVPSPHSARGARIPHAATPAEPRRPAPGAPARWEGAAAASAGCLPRGLVFELSSRSTRMFSFLRLFLPSLSIITPPPPRQNDRPPTLPCSRTRRTCSTPTLTQCERRSRRTRSAFSARAR